jgi:cell shape-determining protein MreC
MKSFRLLILSVSFVLAALVIFFSRDALIHFFGNLRLSFFGAADSDFSYENYENLKVQKEFLIQNCAPEKSNDLSVSSGRYRYEEAQIFSDYPFNNYSAVSVNLGTDDGIKVGMPVLVSEGVLLGKIVAVKRTQSEVETIFNPNWRSAAAFGPEKTKALLVGGPAPHLDLVPKNASSTAGDPVFNLAKDFPINLIIGKILSLEGGENDVWNRAKVEPPVNFEDLKKVIVITNFP